MLGMRRTRPLAALFAALGLSMLASAPAARAAGWVFPLPRSDYTLRPACLAPAPGRARCMALQLVARTAEARAHTHPIGAPRPATASAPAGSPATGEYGLTPEDLHSAYDLPEDAVGPQTVAVVDAYNDPVAAEDLATFSREFDKKLPECTVASGCFSQVNQNGESSLPFPKSEAELDEALQRPGKKREAEEAAGWDVEISLDIETVHAVCESCHIVLVEGNEPSSSSLEAAEDTAARLAQEVSNSWSVPECGGPRDCTADRAAFDHPGVVVAAAAGDEGYLGWLEPGGPSSVSYPASSPHVVAVGGTRLALGTKHEWVEESVWNDGGESDGKKEGYGATGGGCSVQFEAPAWQKALSDWAAVGCAEKRAVSDVSADADPYSGVAVYDSNPGCEQQLSHPDWCTIGGTSLATPLISATYALAGGAGGVAYPAETLYGNLAASPSLLHDVSSGSNGECVEPFEEETGTSGCTAAQEAARSCSSKAICLARSGYDGPTGLGTPDGIEAFTPGANAPGARTGAASATGAETATLAGTAEPDGTALRECRFEYGRTDAYGSSVPCASTPAGTRGAPGVEAQLAGLEPESTYHYRLVVETSLGRADGEDEQFRTPEKSAAESSQGPLVGPYPEAPRPVTGAVQAGSEPAPKSPPVPDAKLASSSLGASSEGMVSARVSCPAAVVSCAGTVSLRTLEAIVLSARGAKSGSRKPVAAILTLASTNFKVAAGAAVNLRLRLSSIGRTLLAHARAHTLRVRSIVFARDPAGATHTAQLIVTIRLPASPARKG